MNLNEPKCADDIWMRRCFDLALKGRGLVSPNPMVGAVIVHENKIIGEGYHKGFGQPHAEVMAFDSVPSGSRHLIPESTLYVNLEPCHHYGKTPPCSLRIQKEKVRSVKVGAVDPNPLVAGEGIAHLRTIGTEVTVGILEKDAVWLNRFFYTYFQKKRPYIILKWAETEDGLIGIKGQRVAISGESAQINSHLWRKEVDAILVGRGTVITDDPVLTERWHGGPDPLRIAIDSNGNIPINTRLLADPEPTWIFSRVSPPISLTDVKQWFEVGEDEEMTDRILQEVYLSGRNSILIEGGSDTLKRWINSSLWDEARVITSPHPLIEGIKAPVVEGELIDRYQAGEDRITVIKR